MTRLLCHIASALCISCFALPAQSDDAPAPPVVLSDYCHDNPFSRDSAPLLPVALTDWHRESCRACEFHRAGCPQCIKAHAVPSETKHYWGWWVGGGTAIGGEEPCLHEGTWGWDYLGTLNHKKVFLNWSHHRYQGGTGAYKVDGPKLHLHK